MAAVVAIAVVGGVVFYIISRTEPPEPAVAQAPATAPTVPPRSESRTELPEASAVPRRTEPPEPAVAQAPATAPTVPPRSESRPELSGASAGSSPDRAFGTGRRAGAGNRADRPAPERGPDGTFRSVHGPSPDRAFGTGRRTGAGDRADGPSPERGPVGAFQSTGGPISKREPARTSGSVHGPSPDRAFGTGRRTGAGNRARRSRPGARASRNFPERRRLHRRSPAPRLTWCESTLKETRSSRGGRRPSRK